jgi:CDP-diglyceride synthetase
MSALLVGKLLVLLALANGAPLVAGKVLGRRWAFPLDGGAAFFDGRPLFGRSKTVRGLVLAILAATAGSLLLGLGWKIGALLGALAMAGDLFSSFIKRRLGLTPSSPALGLDQIPESLFPLIGCRLLLSLTATEIVVVIGLFFVGEVLVSRLLYAFDLRDRPY